MLLRLVKIFLLLVVILAIALVSIPLFFQQQVENLFIKKVNSYFSTQLLIKDKIELSLFSHFPNAALTLNSVELRESLPDSQRNLLEAQKLSFVFGWLDIFRERYVVKQLVIENGRLNLRVFAGGNSNYEVFTNSEAQKGDEQVTIQLKKVDLLNVSVIYLDEIYWQEAEFVIKSGIFSGDFGNTRYNMQLQSNLQVNHYYIYQTNYLPNKEAKLNLNIDIDFADNLYKFGNSTLEVAGNRFDLSGKVQFFERASDVDLAIKGINLNLGEVITMLPDKYTADFKEVQSSTSLNFDALIKGRYTDSEQPEVLVNFNLDKGTLTYPKLASPLQNLQLKGTFTNGIGRQVGSSELNITNLNFTLNGQPINAQLKLSNFNAPVIDAHLSGVLSLSAFEKQAKKLGIEHIAGNLAFDNLNMFGSTQELYSATALAYPTINGNCKTQNLNFTFNGKEIQQFDLELQFNGQHANLNKLFIAAGNSDLTASGQLINFSPMLFQMLGKDTLKLTQPLNLNLQATAQQIDIADLTEYLNPNKPETETPITAQSLQLTDKQQYAIGNINFNLDKVIRNKLAFNDVQGSVSFDDNEFIVQQLTLKLLGGEAELRGSFSVMDNKNVDIKVFINCHNLDMQSFLADNENFGQNEITDKNLKGKFTAKAYVIAPLNPKLQLNEQGFKLIADLSIENGELIDFAPMMALSAYVKLSELKDVKFARLENQIEISNRKVRIPAMYIHSNAVKFTFSGIHTFDNRLLYYVKLNLLDLLTGKFKKKNSSIATDANPKGGINLYLTMSGKSDNPDIQYMKRKKVKQQFERDAQRPKTDLEKILEQEFSLNRSLFTDTIDVDAVSWSDTTSLKK